MFRYLIIIISLFVVHSIALAAEEPAAVGAFPGYGRGFGRGGEPGGGYGKHEGWHGKHGDGHGKGGAPCYSGSRNDNYGACKPVLTSEDAVKRIKESSRDNSVVVSNVVERNWFFKADILDKNGKLLDKVIIHKKSGRVRSIF